MTATPLPTSTAAADVPGLPTSTPTPEPAGTDRDTHFDGGDANSDFRVDSDPRADSNHDGNPSADVDRRSGRSRTSHLDADTRHSDADTRPLQNPRADADSYSDADGDAHQH